MRENSLTVPADALLNGLQRRIGGAGECVWGRVRDAAVAGSSGAGAESSPSSCGVIADDHGGGVGGERGTGGRYDGDCGADAVEGG